MFAGFLDAHNSAMNHEEEANTLLYYGPDEDPQRHAAAPWYIPVGVRDERLLNVYTRGRYLPGGISRSITSSWDWRRLCAIPPSALKSYDGGGNPLEE